MCPPPVLPVCPPPPPIPRGFAVCTGTDKSTTRAAGISQRKASKPFIDNSSLERPLAAFSVLTPMDISFGSSELEFHWEEPARSARANPNQPKIYAVPVQAQTS